MREDAEKFMPHIVHKTNIQMFNVRPMAVKCICVSKVS